MRRKKSKALEFAYAGLSYARLQAAGPTLAALLAAVVLATEVTGAPAVPSPTTVRIVVNGALLEGDSPALILGARVGELNGRPLDIDVPPVISRGRVFVPLRFVAETFGADVGWDPGTRTVRIDTARAKVRQGTDSIIVIFVIVNQTGREVRGRVSVDGREVFEHTIPATVSDTGSFPRGAYPTVELKASLPQQARQLQVVEVTSGLRRSVDITGFSRAGAGFRIVIASGGILVTQDYYPIR